MLTYIPVKNSGYIAVSIQVHVSSKSWEHIHYIEYGFTGFLTHATFRVIIYIKYLCLVIINVLGLVLSGSY